MATEACERILEISSRLVRVHGGEAEARIERKIVRAREAGLWEAVNLWCRVRWRTRLLIRQQALRAA